jgi:hypothetical protein
VTRGAVPVPRVSCGPAAPLRLTNGARAPGHAIPTRGKVAAWAAVADSDAVLTTQEDTTYALTAIDADPVGAVAAEAVWETRPAARARQQIMRKDIIWRHPCYDTLSTLCGADGCGVLSHMCHAVRPWLTNETLSM